jgi:hypothetical protein
LTFYEAIKLQIIEDGKPTETFLMGHLSIFSHSGKPYVIWQDIYIRPPHPSKKTFLKPEYNSVADGSITHVVVTNDHFPFDLRMAPERVMRIVGKLKDNPAMDGVLYSIEAVGIWSNPILKSRIRTEWKAVDAIILPYRDTE